MHHVRRGDVDDLDVGVLDHRLPGRRRALEPERAEVACSTRAGNASLHATSSASNARCSNSVGIRSSERVCAWPSQPKPITPDADLAPGAAPRVATALRARDRRSCRRPFEQLDHLLFVRHRLRAQTAARRRSRRPRWRTRSCARGATRSAARGTARRRTRRPPQPAQHLNRRRLDQPLALLARDQHAVPAELDDRQLDAPGSQPRAASCGSSVPTATAHSSRLPTAIVACATAAPIRADASSRERQNVGR